MTKKELPEHVIEDIVDGLADLRDENSLDFDVVGDGDTCTIMVDDEDVITLRVVAESDEDYKVIVSNDLDEFEYNNMFTAVFEALNMLLEIE